MSMVKPKGNEDEISIVEEREELMVSVFGNGKPYLRTVHFLKPSLSPIDEIFSLPHSDLPYTFQPQDWPLKVKFEGWMNPNDDLVSWVDIMRPKCQAVWEKAGICEAIMKSTCSIKRYNDLVFGLAEKWNPETNTFIFPWGETTISLEDVIILGGYSVVGFPITFPGGDSQQLKEAEDKLFAECRKIRGGKRRKITLREWRDHFIGSERDIEHEAFLTWWLTRFVFQASDLCVQVRLFPIACLLARGQLVALGPAILARIYRDLTLLKETIVSLTRFKAAEFDDCVSNIRLHSQMELVQLWAWERFPALQPKPNVIRESDPRSARWNNVGIVKVENVRMVLDSAGETFDWRPYAKVVNNKQSHIFYKEKGEWITIDGSSSKELVSFALCLRPSELVGLGPGYIQQYLPHRVAMQFGIDQDVPSHVARSNESLEIAWKNYVRPINGRKLYIPSRFFESDVTVRYLECWKKGETLVQQDVIKDIVQRKRSSRKRSERIPWVQARKGDNEASMTPGFLPKLITVKPEPFVDEVEPEAFEVSNKKARVTTRPVGHDNCSVDKAQGLSSSMADNGGSVTVEFSMTATPKATHIKDQSEGPARVRREAIEGKLDFSPYGKDNISTNGKSNTFMEADMISSRLEAQIARLERVVTELKAEYKLGRNPTKEDN